MMVFQVDKTEYRGSTALDIVRAMESDAREYPNRGHPLQEFLQWSLESLSNQIPPRDLHLSRVKAEELALHYLCLRDEFGAGKLLIDRDSEA